MTYLYKQYADNENEWQIFTLPDEFIYQIDLPPKNGARFLCQTGLKAN